MVQGRGSNLVHEQRDLRCPALQTGSFTVDPVIKLHKKSNRLFQQAV
jgi:hypothetical protein